MKVSVRCVSLVLFYFIPLSSVSCLVLEPGADMSPDDFLVGQAVQRPQRNAPVGIALLRVILPCLSLCHGARPSIVLS